MIRLWNLLVDLPDAKGDFGVAEVYRAADEDALCEPAVGTVFITFEFGGGDKVVAVRAEEVDPFIGDADHCGVGSHDVVDCPEIVGFAQRVYELMISSSRQDFGVQVACHIAASDGDCHLKTTIRIFAFVDRFTDLGPYVEDVFQRWSLSRYLTW